MPNGEGDVIQRGARTPPVLNHNPDIIERSRETPFGQVLKGSSRSAVTVLLIFLRFSISVEVKAPVKVKVQRGGSGNFRHKPGSALIHRDYGVPDLREVVVGVAVGGVFGKLNLVLFALHPTVFIHSQLGNFHSQQIFERITASITVGYKLSQRGQVASRRQNRGRDSHVGDGFPCRDGR